MKKYTSTQELVNIYPPWARVRTDEQSVGYQLLNAMARPMDEMSKSLKKMEANEFLVTANLDEIDIVYRADLPVTFDFDEDNNDPAVIRPIAPTVSGYLDGVWYNIEAAVPNSLPAFWYDSCPNRASIAEVVSGVTHELAEFTVSGLVESGLWEHHLGGGHLHIEAEGDGSYLFLEDDELRRARLAIFGETRQGLEELETIIYPWAMRQRSRKEWKNIERFEFRDFPENITLRVRSADFDQDDYISVWNQRYSKNRNKIDEFWGLGATVSGSSLDRIEYVTDEWQLLVRGMIEKDVIESWELLDENGNEITFVDMALQPWTDNAWMVTSGGTLCCYEATSSMVSGVSKLRDRTPGTNVQIDIEPRWVLIGEDITFVPWYARPVEIINKYRLWYETPSGQRYGLVDSQPVSYNSDFWVRGDIMERTVESIVSIPATERGEYLIGMDVVYNSEVTDDQSERMIVSVNHKFPKGTVDLSSLIEDEIIGIDFDADQRMWIRTADKYYKIDLHTDIMLIDYEQKIVYFKEPYEEVVVNTDG